ncbi:fungal mating-type pheromone [Hygrophoropsis aurantiaca]|uniref:Fungal mating-type pheromone n=1 Tax=Hygrophoropsis aurantiaca TaxID=72124 RepID=A0ACB8AEB0_9AGAM|nr:fungal mating-type pheromone [Hygrophoropsis aurantiaca]
MDAFTTLDIFGDADLLVPSQLDHPRAQSSSEDPNSPPVDSDNLQGYYGSFCVII